MNALVVVHTERPYTDPRIVGEHVREYQTLFDKIAQEIGRFLAKGKVYYLSGGNRLPSSRLIYAPIRAYFPDMVYVPTNPRDFSESQFLRAKEFLIDDSAQEVLISGVGHYACVMMLYELLKARARAGDFKEAIRYLGWTEKKFRRIFRHKLNAHIREDLTDKLFTLP